MQFIFETICSGVHSRWFVRSQRIPSGPAQPASQLPERHYVCDPTQEIDFNFYFAK